MRSRRSGDADGGFERGILVTRIQLGDNGDIIHMQRRQGDEVGFTRDAAEVPEIAFVQIAGGGFS